MSFVCHDGIRNSPQAGINRFNRFDCRIENLLNQRLPTNLGSPFQGSRYTLPIRVLAGFNWTLGKDMTKLVSNPQTAKKAVSI